jgi:hypothetical protein
MTGDSCLKESSKLRNLKRLHGGAHNKGESITNTNNSTDRLQNLKSFLGMSLGPGGVVDAENGGDDKSHDTVSFKIPQFCV